jgi:hypothetical protein
VERDQVAKSLALIAAHKAQRRAHLAGAGRVTTMFRRWILVAASLVLLGGCGAEDPDGSAPSLAGVWSLASYADHGVVATTSGTATFDTDGSFAITGELTYPGEPADSLLVHGNWSMTGNRVVLTTGEGSGTWVVNFAASEATLVLEGPAPTNVIHLHRQGAFSLAGCSAHLRRARASAWSFDALES